MTSFYVTDSGKTKSFQVRNIDTVGQGSVDGKRAVGTDILDVEHIGLHGVSTTFCVCSQLHVEGAGTGEIFDRNRRIVVFSEVYCSAVLSENYSVNKTLSSGNPFASIEGEIYRTCLFNNLFIAIVIIEIGIVEHGVGSKSGRCQFMVIINLTFNQRTFPGQGQIDLTSVAGIDVAPNDGLCAGDNQISGFVSAVGISLADDLMLLAGATGELDSYSEEDLLTMDGYAIPLALQLSSDKSVMLLYVLMKQGDNGYQPMLVLPLSKVSSLDFPKATGSHFSKTMRSTMSEVMDMAKTAEQKLGSDGSDVLYNLFAVPLFNSNVSSTGKWNVEVTSGDTEFLERIFGGYMYSLMGSMTTGGGYEIWSYDGPSDPSMTYHYSLAYGDGATSGYANFNVTSSGKDPNEVTMMVQVSFRGLPVYEGTLRLTRDTSLSFMDVCEEMVASSSGPSTGYIELRSNGQVWFGYGETEAEGMNICVGTYGLDGGKIVIETASDLLPELEGLSISFGGLFGYSQSGDSAEIMILQQKNGADFGLEFNAVG